MITMMMMDIMIVMIYDDNDKYSYDINRPIISMGIIMKVTVSTIQHTTN